MSWQRVQQNKEALSALPSYEAKLSRRAARKARERVLCDCFWCQKPNRLYDKKLADIISDNLEDLVHEYS